MTIGFVSLCKASPKKNTMLAVAHSLKEKPRTGDVLISENVNFEGLLLSETILKGLKASGFERPSPIQLKAIPLGRCGLDLIVQAKSGTGKTCVFSVIALESLQLDSSALQVLVLAPTREIAIQIWDVIKSIGQALPQLKCHTFIGGMPLQEDKLKLKKCHIAVGTPGRIKQLIEQGMLSIENIRLFVLDEADKLLEESFQEQINWIYSTLPDNKQMLALSATYPEYLAQHLTAYMRNPTFLRLNVSDPALLGIKQYYKPVKFHPLPNKLFESKVEVVTTILSSADFQQCLVFSNLQTMAQNMADALNSKGWPTACIAGSLDQKDRNLAMSKLKTFQCRVLISTDLTSRGIDADKVNLVINLDVPKDHETYLHRIGRAGRFGTFGACVSIVSEGQEMINLHSVEKKCNTHVSPLPDPIPTDLVKTQGTINLDDMVSTEKIFTSKQNGHVQGKPSDQTETSKKSNSDQKHSINRNDITCFIDSPDSRHSKVVKENGHVIKSDEKVEQSESSVIDKQTASVYERNVKNSVKEAESADIKEMAVAQGTVINGIKALSLNEKSNPCLSKQTADLSDTKVVEGSRKTVTEEILPCRETVDSEKSAENTESPEKIDVTKIKSKPKKHSGGNFWTQLIVERNDDEEFIQDFQASPTGDDIFDIALELAKESQRVNEKKTETLKRKVAKRESESRQNANVDANEISKVKVEIKSSACLHELKIPSLRETISLKRLQNSHTYKTAVASHQLYKENSGTNNGLDSSSDQKTSVNIPQTVNYELELLQKVKDILSLSPPHASYKNSDKSLQKAEKGKTAIDDKETTEGRATIKARRNKNRQSNEKVKLDKSVEKLGKKESSSLQNVVPRNHTELVDYNYLDSSFLHDVENKQAGNKGVKQKSANGQKLKSAQKDEWVLENSVDYSYLESSYNDNNDHQMKKDGDKETLKTERSWKQQNYRESQLGLEDQVDYSYLESNFDDSDRNRLTNTNYTQSTKSISEPEKQAASKHQHTRSRNVYEDSSSELSNSESESFDSSESSSDTKIYESADHRRDYSYSYSHKNTKPSKCRQSNRRSSENHWQEPTYNESSDEESEYPSDPWKYYRNRQQFQNLPPPHYPYMYHQNPYYPMPSYPYMGGYYPYSCYYPWQNPYCQLPQQNGLAYQMPQQNGLSHQKMYENLAMQQKYIKKMLKSYRKTVSKK